MSLSLLLVVNRSLGELSDLFVNRLAKAVICFANALNLLEFFTIDSNSSIINSP